MRRLAIICLAIAISVPVAASRAAIKAAADSPCTSAVVGVCPNDPTSEQPVTVCVAGSCQTPTVPDGAVWQGVAAAEAVVNQVVGTVVTTANTAETLITQAANDPHLVCVGATCAGGGDSCEVAGTPSDNAGGALIVAHWYNPSLSVSGDSAQCNWNSVRTSSHTVTVNFVLAAANCCTSSPFTVQWQVYCNGNEITSGQATSTTLPDTAGAYLVHAADTFQWTGNAWDCSTFYGLSGPVLTGPVETQLAWVGAITYT